MINIPEDFEELLDELNQVDGFGGALAIYDTSLATRLVNMGLAIQNVRHSYGGTQKLSDLLEKKDFKDIIQDIQNFES